MINVHRFRNFGLADNQGCGSGMIFSDPDSTTQLASDLDPVSDPNLSRLQCFPGAA
jgi:hypothetical protein